MIKGTIKRVTSGYEVNIKFMGYGNMNIIEACNAEGIDIKKQAEALKLNQIVVIESPNCPSWY